MHCRRYGPILRPTDLTVKRGVLFQPLHIVEPQDAGDRLADAVRSLLEEEIDVDEPDRVAARLAAGDFEGVRAALADAGDVPGLPLTLARYVAWSGDLRTAAGMWARVRAALGPAMEDERYHPLRAATCVEVQRLATDLGDPQLAARLAGIARSLGGSPVPGDVVPGGAAAVVHELTAGLLGLEPDAARGRLRIAPDMLTSPVIDARSIRFGDATLSIDARSDSGTMTVRVEQDSGALPVTALLEPIVPAYAGAMIDGLAADLTPRLVAGGVVVPVQVVLDAARTLVITTG